MTSSGWTRQHRCEYRQTTVQEPWGATAAQKTWRALNASQLITDVIDGVPFVNGIRKKAA